MLLVTDPANDPILEKLTHEARTAYINAVAHCVRYRTDLMTPHDILRLGPQTLVEEWAGVRLAQPLPWGHVRLLGRPGIWDFGTPGR